VGDLQICCLFWNSILIDDRSVVGDLQVGCFIWISVGLMIGSGWVVGSISFALVSLHDLFFVAIEIRGG
jgi:hypothetical protein